MRKRFNQYYLTEQIANNSSGSVYLAHHVSDGPQKVLLEILDTASFTFNQQDENVFQKIKLIKQLKHSSIVPIIDLGIERGRLYVVREYHTCESLRHLLDRLSPQRLNLQEALAIILQVGQVLAYAHQHQAVHGSITPETIFLKRNGEVLLSDFGLADFIDIKKSSQESDPRTTSYIAPEQFAGSFTEKSDQYALACLAYELITGCVPFSAQSTFSVISPISVKDLFEKEIERGESENKDQAVPDQDGSFCENSQCPDYGKVGKNNIYKYGKTRKGAQRWRCRTCKTTWSSSPTRARHRQEFLIPLSDLVADLPKPIQEAVLKAMAKDPSDRYANVSFFLKVLEEAWPSTLSVISQQSLMVPPSNTTKVPTAAERREDLENDISLPTPRNETLMSSPLGIEDHHVNISLVTPRNETLLTTHLSERSKDVSNRYESNKTLLATTGDNTYTEASWGSRFTSPGKSSTSTFWLAFALSGIILLLGTVLLYVLVPLRSPASIGPVKGSPTALGNNTTPLFTPANLTTPTLVANPYSPYTGQLILDDPLSDNSRGYGWQVTPLASSNGRLSCQFIGEAYYAYSQDNIYNTCRPSLKPSNFTFEVQMRIVSGDCGGITLRYDGHGNGYSYQVCQDGSYTFDRLASRIQTLVSASSAAIVIGSDQSNLIAIVVDGSRFDLYVNHQKLTSINDSTYNAGTFGLTSDNSDVAYTNARLWSLQSGTRSP